MQYRECIGVGGKEGRSMVVAELIAGEMQQAAGVKQIIWRRELQEIFEGSLISCSYRTLIGPLKRRG